MNETRNPDADDEDLVLVTAFVAPYELRSARVAEAFAESLREVKRTELVRYARVYEERLLPNMTNVVLQMLCPPA